MNRRALWLELSFLFVLLPFIVYAARQRWIMIALLWGLTALSILVLKRTQGLVWRNEWNWDGAKAGFREIGKRFAMMAVLIAAFTVVHDYERFLTFPLHRPGLWIAVMALYPILSALPQEIVFRSFFFRRYGELIGSERYTILASAITFGFAHLVFRNWIAILFCAFGGWLFAKNYAKHRSLALVMIEHALYGCYIFTIGLGYYFYNMAWRP